MFISRLFFLPPLFYFSVEHFAFLIYIGNGMEKQPDFKDIFVRESFLCFNTCVKQVRVSQSDWLVASPINNCSISRVT